MPYWRLSSVYFFYFSVVGALAPFWGLYLSDLGFSPKQIGVLFAIPMVTKLVAPNLWSWFSDRSGKGIRIIQLGALGACLCFVGVFYRTDYVGLMFFIALYSVFWNAVLPQFESTTLFYLRDQVQNYSKIRLWGSVGFIVTVVGLGLIFEVLPIGYLPNFIFAFLCGIFIFTCALPHLNRQRHSRHANSFFSELMKPHLIAFYAVLFFLQLSHGVYYTFYSIYLESHGYTKSLIGVLWAFGVICEIIIFLVVPRLFRTFSLYTLLSFSLLVTAMRWLLIGEFPDHISIIVVAQVFHAFSFGMVHAVAIHYIKLNFSDAAQGQSQAFYSAASYGGGAAVGAYGSGVIWAFSPQMSFVLAAFFALLAWGLCGMFLRKSMA